MKKRSIIHHLILAAVLLVCSGGLFGGSGPVHAGELINTGYFGGVAIKGYDPVAYFTEGRAMKGSKEFVYEWLGTPWYFANARHRDLFAADPVKYAPQFGGYCALGMASGQSTANIDPEGWRIIDGKLYLNATKAGPLLDQLPGQITQAEATWPKVAAKLNQ